MIVFGSDELIDGKTLDLFAKKELYNFEIVLKSWNHDKKYDIIDTFLYARPTHAHDYNDMQMTFKYSKYIAFSRLLKINKLLGK